ICSFNGRWVATAIDKRARIEGTAPLGGRRQLQKTRPGALDLAGALVIREPEKLVLPERPSDRVTKLVAPEFRLGLIEEVACIEFVVAQELEGVAVNAIGAGLGYRVHHRAAEFSVFGVKAIGDEAKFLDGVQIGNQSGAQIASLPHVPAVH